jgi:hypothetical protein
MPDRTKTCLAAIASISHSADVRRYVIGFTSREGMLRGDEYRGVGFNHLVILADRLTSKEGLDLECALFNAICGRGSDRRSNLFRKYDRKKRSRGYRRSYGGHVSKRSTAVYMAWA